MNLLADPPPAAYLIAGAAVIVLGAVAAQKQDRRSVALFAIGLVVLLAVFLIDRLVDSPREGAVRSARAMADAADTNRPQEFVRHVADTLVYQGEGQPVTATREQLQKARFWNMLRQYNAHVAVWDFARDDVKPIDDGTVEIGFLAKGQTRGDLKQVQLYVRATFRRQPDGSMKMTQFRTFDWKNRQEPVTLPNFPN